jgi:hypothetical protein
VTDQEFEEFPDRISEHFDRVRDALADELDEE